VRDFLGRPISIYFMNRALAVILKNYFRAQIVLTSPHNPVDEIVSEKRRAKEEKKNSDRVRCPRTLAWQIALDAKQLVMSGGRCWSSMYNNKLIA